MPPPPAREPAGYIDEDEVAAAALAAKRSKKAPSVSKRPRDVFMVDSASTSDLLRKPVEPSDSVMQPVTPEPASVPEPFSIDAYPQMRRFMTEAIMRSASFDQSGADRDAQNVKNALVHAQQRQAGVTAAALTNHMIRIVSSERARTTNADGIMMLDSTPYADSNQSAFSSNFIASSIECAPDVNAHEHIPTNEMRAASRPLKYAYIESYMRTAHPSEFKCAGKAQCVGQDLYDEHGVRLSGTTWKVFWFPEEAPLVAADPEKFEAEAKYRYCIGCKIERANKCLINAAARNNRVMPEVLATDFHVFVDIPGEYPLVATRGRCSDGHYGLVQNVPVFSRVGWTETPDGQRANCYTYKSNIPCYPIPRSFYERDTATATSRGF